MSRDDNRKPNGDLATRTIAMPAHTNPNGDIFGGWVVSQMDLGGAVLAGKIAQGRIATVAIDAMTFIFPVRVGDIVSCYSSLKKIGNTSIAVKVEVWVMRGKDINTKEFCATEGLFTYVAIDKDGKPTPVKK